MLELEPAFSSEVLRDCWKWSLPEVGGESAAMHRSIQPAYTAKTATKHRKIKDAIEIID